ncbi:MAG: rhodanese-like domain-containing protein [Geobacter sp.]|nr:rhodanese-like domain-containing protein [Geobacter sp.]
MQAKDLARRLKESQAPCVVDVRTGMEYKGGHIPQAIHAPAWKILFRLAPLPTDKESQLVVTCEHGPRAQVAAALLGFAGYRNVELLEGHMAGWRRTGLPCVKG